jgi:outer membrane protein assembly factor BamB
MINGVCLSGHTIYLSLRNTSGIIGVDRATKEVVWKKQWPDVAQQHCPVVTPAGTIIAFCNGNIRPPSVHHSRIVEFDLETKEQIWSYVDDMPPSFFSPYMGSVQRLWNGNTFICESAFGRLFEVTPEGETVWEYVIPWFEEYPSPLNEFITGAQNSCFKAHRYKAWE